MPGQVYAYGNLAICEFYRNRFEQAPAALALGAQRKLVLPDTQILSYAIDFVQGDRQDMDRIAAATQGQSSTEHWMLYSQAFVLAHDGRLRMARTKAKEAEDLAGREGQPGPAANYQAALAFQEALYGNTAEAKTGSNAALRRSRSRRHLRAFHLRSGTARSGGPIAQRAGAGRGSSPGIPFLRTRH